MWTYQNPVQIQFGEGAVAGLNRQLVGQRVLLVTDRGLMLCGMVDRVRAAVPDVEVTVFGEIEPNPTADVINCGGQFAAAGRYDAILGLGGGSALDAAKAIALVATTGMPIESFLGGAALPLSLALPVIAVPTTAGTGSEVTPVSVITWTARATKSPLAGPCLFPTQAIVDPELTDTLPATVTATTGMDALSHGIEAYWSIHSQPITDALARDCVRRVLRYLPRAVADGGDREARREMALASLLGGMAFALPKTAAVHACSFPLTHRFGIPHGLACSLTLPSFMTYNHPAMREKMDELARSVGYAHCEVLFTAVRQLPTTIGLPTRLSAFGIVHDDLDQLVAESFHPNMQNNPRPVTPTILKALYEEIH